MTRGEAGTRASSSGKKVASSAWGETGKEPVNGVAVADADMSPLQRLEPSVPPAPAPTLRLNTPSGATKVASMAWLDDDDDDEEGAGGIGGADTRSDFSVKAEGACGIARSSASLSHGDSRALSRQDKQSQAQGAGDGASGTDDSPHDRGSPSESLPASPGPQPGTPSPPPKQEATSEGEDSLDGCSVVPEGLRAADDHGEAPGGRLLSHGTRQAVAQPRVESGHDSEEESESLGSSSSEDEASDESSDLEVDPDHDLPLPPLLSR